VANSFLGSDISYTFTLPHARPAISISEIICSDSKSILNINPYEYSHSISDDTLDADVLEINLLNPSSFVLPMKDPVPQVEA
jgi:hypothetical protein